MPRDGETEVKSEDDGKRRRLESDDVEIRYERAKLEHEEAQKKMDRREREMLAEIDDLDNELKKARERMQVEMEGLGHEVNKSRDRFEAVREEKVTEEANRISSSEAEAHKNVEAPETKRPVPTLTNSQIKAMKLTAIVRHLDKSEPHEDWYQRQMDNRGECSSLRGKLRKFARANPGHPATTHWEETGKWEPPNEEVLFALMDLIKSIIVKSGW